MSARYDVIKDLVEKKFASAYFLDVKDAVREVVQEIFLYALQRTDFFEHAAFFGGTALRIFHRLPRCSEDMDFTVVPDSAESFDLNKYSGAISAAFMEYGLETEFVIKTPNDSSLVDKARLKLSLADVYEIAGVDSNLYSLPKSSPKYQIKIDIEKDAPEGAGTEIRSCLIPISFPVRVCTIPTLYAGKMSAILMRDWGARRVKGRDWFDLLWYVKFKRKFDTAWLCARLRQRGRLAEDELLTSEKFAELYMQKVDALDIDRAKADMEPFLGIDNSDVRNWSKSLFYGLCQMIIDNNAWE